MEHTFEIPLLTDEPSVYSKLTQLRDEAEIILETASEMQRDGVLKINGSIIWSDLHIVDVGYKVSLNDDEQYYIEIEEVSPYSYELQKYMADHLRTNWGSVEVITNW